MKKSKGFSLLELIVAIAMCSIAMVAISGMIVNASRAYSTETAKVSVSNNIQSVFTRVEDALMESMALEKDGGYIVTDVVDSGTGLYLHKAGKTIYYDASAGRLYMSNLTKSSMTGTALEGALLAKNITAFEISISNDCIKKDDEGNEYLINPLRFNVKLTADVRKRKISYSREVAMRNKVDTIVFDGVTYSVK